MYQCWCILCRKQENNENAKRSVLFLFIDWLQNQCGDVLFNFFGNIFLSVIHVKMCTSYWNQIKLSIHKVWWLREAAQTYLKKSFKAQCGRIPIDPVILAAIRQCRADARV